ncbi:hypothetical protein AgCh_004634 [Apium graveolens]
MQKSSTATTPMATTTKLDPDEGNEAKPREPHLVVVKRILRYLNGTQSLALWEHVMEGTIELHFVPTDQQVVDTFTKPLPEATFAKLIHELGMFSHEKKLSVKS